jgi:hemoglobin
MIKWFDGFFEGGRMGLYARLKTWWRSPYRRLGGQRGITQLVAAFYHVMDSDVAAAEVRALHPSDLVRAQEKLTAFLCGWTGGPRHYEAKYGPPRMRMRHMPFAIGALERRQWMACMEAAMEQRCVPRDLRESLRQGFEGLAERIQNRD